MNYKLCDLCTFPSACEAFRLSGFMALTERQIFGSKVAGMILFLVNELNEGYSWVFSLGSYLFFKSFVKLWFYVGINKWFTFKF